MSAVIEKRACELPLGRRLGPKGYPGAGLSTAHVARLARECVTDVLGGDPLDLRAGGRGSRKRAFARQVAMHLVHTVAGRVDGDTARAFGRNRSTGTHNVERIEWWREAHGFDRWLDLMELRFEAMLKFAELPGARHAWGEALQDLRALALDPYIDDAVGEAAEYLVETFMERT